MPKIDCSVTTNFLTELKRMCDSQFCSKCALSSTLNGCDTHTTCEKFIRKNSKRALEVVQEWSDKNRPESYKENFLRIFPNAPVNQINMVGTYPAACRNNIYGESEDCSNLCKAYHMDCNECWNAIYKQKGGN